MLILTRKQNESVIIDDDIKVTILGTKGQDVKIGIDAPDDVEIWREEIYTKMQNDDQTASGGGITCRGMPLLSQQWYY